MSGTRKWQEACDILGADIRRLEKQRDELTALLLEALPYVEEGEEFHKPRLRRAFSRRIKAALEVTR